MKKQLFFLVMVGPAIFLASCRQEGQKNVAFLAGREVGAAPVRERYWAQPMYLYGVPNFCRVSGDLYRGDEPTRNGMISLNHLGVRTVVCVRSAHSTESRLHGLNMRYTNIAMKAWEPTDEEVIQFLRIMADSRNRPVFIHCYTGGDRAGLLTAIYRVAFCGWTKEQAREEMLFGGYGFHEILIKYLAGYFDQCNIEELKARAGVTAANITAADRAAAIPMAIPQPMAPEPASPVQTAVKVR